MNVYETRGQPARVPTTKASSTEPKRGFRPPQHCPALTQVVSRKVQAAVPEQGMVRPPPPAAHTGNWAFHSSHNTSAATHWIKKKNIILYLQGGLYLSLVFVDNQDTKRGRVCSFSPCIEQVQKTCEAFSDQGFEDINSLEVLLRVHDVRTVYLPLPDFGPDPSAQIQPDSTITPPQNHASIAVKTTIPPRDVQGHTGYLTFATKPRT
nr:PREDICTED: tRNA (adenine(58)-N(1))-methyltransferase catalytic subunit TRMT61A [Notothenia coriiceps]